VLPADLSSSYGGPYEDAEPVENPTVQIGADLFNRAAEDTAQMTRTCWRAIVKFTTDDAGGEPYGVAVTSHTSIWGMGEAHEPEIAKTAAGEYQITYAESYTDALDEEEDVAFTYCQVAIGGATAGHGQDISIASNVVTVGTFDMAGVASDLGGTATVTVFLR
jgi:hypothetical protein